jgi:predicted Zn-dependent protease
MRRARRLLPIVAGAALATTLVGCPVNPATGKRQLILISQGTEIEMGREGAKQVEAALGLYDDPDLQAYVSEVGEALAARSEKPDLPWSFKVIDDPVVNAFALPGGFIFVTRGILGYFNSEAELAAVLGHEIGHVTARHSAEQISRAQLTQLGLGVGSVFMPEIQRYSDLLDLGVGLLFLKFSRDDERQADELGLRYMSRGGYDPDEMTDVFAMLGRVSEASGGGSVPGWLSTHPQPEEREERIKRLIAEAGYATDGAVGRERYLERIDGLVFGENARNGFFRGATFLHPDLRFRLEFPEGWRTQNMAQAVAALSPDKDAAMQLTLAQEGSIDVAAERFLSQSGLRRGDRWRAPVNGLPALWSYFAATTQRGGELRGLVVFIAYGGRVYQILGYTTASRMATYDPVFRSALGSFDELRDPSALNVQPKRIEIVRLERPMALAEFARRYPSTVDLSVLALINGVEEDGTLPAGLAKRVVGGRVPGE